MTPTPPPPWLPELVPFRGDWVLFVRALYALFSNDFKSGRLRFRGRPVWYDRRVLPDDNRYEEGFWHLVTRDDLVWNPTRRCKEKQRLPEIERARHLPWGKPVIEHEVEPRVLVWDIDEVKKTGKAVVRTYLWIQDFDFLVILEKQATGKGDIFMLITTFLVDAPGKRVDLEGRYKRRKR